MYMIGASLSVLAAWIVWNFMWKKTILDTARDYLFDLRDSSRAWFIKEGYGIDNKSYNTLRMLINVYLRHLEKMSLLDFLLAPIDSNSEEYKKVAEELNAAFNTGDKKVDNFMKCVRVEAFNAVSSFMVLRNFPALVIVSIAAVVKLVQIVFQSLSNAITSKKRESAIGLRVVAASLIAVISLCPAFSKTRVEAYTSYEEAQA